MESEHVGEPIQILKLNPSTGKQELDEQKVKNIFLKDDLENVELSIVSIAGAFRKGKSFLLSFFLRFLNFYYENESGKQQKYNFDWLSDQNAKLSGFGWRGGCDRHTTGIWIWSKIFTKTMPNGQRIGIVLMDTQGMFDHQSDMHSNVTIFALSTMLSSIQIFNLFNQIQEDDLQHLQLFTEYGRIAMENGEIDSKPFQQLMFLVRDWNFPTEYPYGLLGGNNFLEEKVLKVKPNSPPGTVSVREHLQASFDEKTCFLMPNPGENVRTNPNFDGRLCDIAPEFIKHLNSLITYLLKPENICRSGLKKVNGSKVKPKEFVHLLQQFWKAVKSGKLLELKNILEASTEALCLSARSEIDRWYYKIMSSLIKSSDVEVPQLLNAHKNLLEEALKTYDRLVMISDQHLRRQHRQEMKTCLQESLMSFLSIHLSKKSQSMEEMVTKLSTEIAQVRARGSNQENEFLSSVNKQLQQLQDYMKSSQEQGDQHLRRQHRQEMKTCLQESPTSFLSIHQSKKSQSMDSSMVTKLSTEIAQLRTRGSNQENELVSSMNKQFQQFQDYMKSSQEQQMKYIETILEAVKQNNQRPRSNCSIM